MTSFSKRIRELEQQVADLQSGAYVQSSPLGPGRINSSQLKAKTITSNMLNVSDLESVATKTGTLSVTGPLTAGSGASTMAYDPSNGLYLGAASFASAPFRVTPAGALTGTNATITGAVTSSSLSATGGTIGTFGITATDGLAQGTGSNTRGISAGSTTFYAGSATPASAPFRVDRFGNVHMENAAITGSSTFSGSLSGASGTFSGSLSSASGTFTGALSSATGSFSGSLSAATGSFAGSLSGATGTFSGGVTASSLSLTGGLTFSGSGSIALPGGGSITSSGLDINSATFAGITVDGTITLGSGGKIIDADGSYWDQNGIVLIGAGTVGDTLSWYTSGVLRGGISASSSIMNIGSASGVNMTIYARGADPSIQLTNGDITLAVNGYTPANLSLKSTGATAQFGGKIYPGNGSAQQTSYYIDAGSSGAIITNGIGIGGMLGISSGNTINFISPSTGGSANTWSSFAVANVPDTNAGYLKIQIGGTNYRVPFYVDS